LIGIKLFYCVCAIFPEACQIAPLTFGKSLEMPKQFIVQWECPPSSILLI